MSSPLARAAGKVAIPRDHFPSLSPRAYGLVVVGKPVRPEFAAGDVLVIDPDRVPKQGDLVVAYEGSSVSEYAGGTPGLFHVIVGYRTAKAAVIPIFWPDRA